MEIHTIKFGFDNLISNLEKNINFSFSRFGDGELNCAFGKKGKNCDGHEYFEDMGLELKKILESSPKYNVSIQPHGYNIWKHKILELKGIEFSNSDIIHNASVSREINKLFKILDNKNVLLVGPKHLSKLNEFKINNHIVIPSENCWLHYKTIEESIRKILKPDIVILYSASMMSNVIIDNLYNEFKNTITQIDCGSVFDPYVGLSTRTYHKKMLNILYGGSDL